MYKIITIRKKLKTFKNHREKMSKCVNGNKSRHTYVHNIHQLLNPDIGSLQGFPQVLRTLGGGALQNLMGGERGGLKCC